MQRGGAGGPDAARSAPRRNARDRRMTGDPLRPIAAAWGRDGYWGAVLRRVGGDAAQSGFWLATWLGLKTTPGGLCCRSTDRQKMTSNAHKIALGECRGNRSPRLTGVPAR